jgi:hypothetical protein
MNVVATVSNSEREEKEFLTELWGRGVYFLNLICT